MSKNGYTYPGGQSVINFVGLQGTDERLVVGYRIRRKLAAVSPSYRPDSLYYNTLTEQLDVLK